VVRAERERKRMKTIFRIWWRARISRVRLSKDKKISVGGTFQELVMVGRNCIA